MEDRAKKFMDLVWERRNNGADTEEELVSEILSIVTEEIKYYTAQDGRIVLDKQDVLELAKGLKDLKNG